MRLSFIRVIVLFLAFFVSAQSLSAQDILKDKDLSLMKVAQLSDADITNISQQLKAAGTTIEAVEHQLIAKGLPPEEYTKLKERLAQSARKGQANSTGGVAGRSRIGRASGDSSQQETDMNEKQLIDPRIFGSELFNNSSGNSFAANTSIATPINYEIGPKDVLNILVYGIQQYSGDLTVSNEGRITIPSVGEVRVGGMSIEAATQRLSQVMGGSVYGTLRTGASKLSVTLGDTRTIHITVIGGNRPGTYNVPSLSTVFTALVIAGGPSNTGSFRSIELLRNNRTERKIDLYRFLAKGDQSDNVSLKDNDVIRIPTYKSRVELQGQVKRPGLFEILPNESVNDLLELASGFDDTAYTASIRVIQKGERERQVKDLASGDYNTYKPRSGDLFIVSKILNRFENRVTVTGAVYRPGPFELTPGMRISDLLKKADGVRQDAYTSRAQIMRLKENMVKELVSINLSKVLQDDAKENILLQKEDELLVSSVLELRDTFNVVIQGEIRLPGKYAYADSMTVKDLIMMSGGFKDAANRKVEIARMIRSDSAAVGRVNDLIYVDINGDLSFNDPTANIILRPYDVISVVKKPGYITPEVVTVTGEVQRAGKYTLLNRLDRVSDVLKRTGGLMDDAYVDGAYVKRYRFVTDTLKSDETKSSIEKSYLRNLKSQQADQENDLARSAKLDNTDKRLGQYNGRKGLKDTLDILFDEKEREFYQIALDLRQIQKTPGSAEDLILKDRDELIIPKFDNKIRISGGVLRPTNIVYNEGLTIEQCISAGGGVTEYAKRGRAYVIYPNGKAAKTRHFLFFRSDPKIVPGSEIVVPETTDKRANTIQSILTFTGVLAQISSLFLTFYLVNK